MSHKITTEDLLHDFWSSKAGLICLLLVALTLTAAAFTFQALQGPSLLWHIDGDEAVVTVVRFPTEAATRAYKWSSISNIESFEMPEKPGTFAIVYLYSGLNLRSPWQNSDNISRYDIYYPALKEFFRQARLDNNDAKLRHYHRAYPLALASSIAATGMWSLFFITALRHGKPVSKASS
ncbi:MAG: hypothetical protein DRJ61_03245 [Acidobacteria bacterium]|nr:MAG: hypothetical protein DRJ61_03245 [Acidobacteriota bacterium]